MKKTLKGIVSRDFVVFFWCHSIDLKFVMYTCGACSFAFKISISCRIFLFSFLGVEAVASLIPQLDSQGKLTIRRDTKIEKFDTKTKFKKQKEHAPEEQKLQIY
jgi:hypothetical protein